MIQKHILRRLLGGFYVLQFSAFLLCLACYSYRTRELLVCWLFFCSLFAVLAVMFLGAVLACYAGQYLVRWRSAANRVIPELEVCLVEVLPEVNSGPRILVAGAFEALAGPCESVAVLSGRPCLLIEVAPSAAEEAVRK